eukprot:TRINITY_DN28782_c0_g1_i1.p1 TRINITY_DN28782_c0_g1~~TRINITY_DN28782_c0_g1_i1.p1  ORF type:complete len:353 (+),score=71.04 TRINITY_DN28782_c0_g1_i1:14-1072(+)
MRLLLPSAAARRKSWQDGSQLYVDVASAELATILAEQASQDDVLIMLSTLKELLPELFYHLASCPTPSNPVPSYKRLHLGSQVASGQPTKRPRPSNIYTQGPDLYNSAKVEDDYVDVSDAGTRYDVQAYRVKTEAKGIVPDAATRKPRRQNMIERELLQCNQIEGDLDVELLYATEEHLRGKSHPVDVSELKKEVETKFQEERPWLSEALKSRVTLRRQLIDKSRELVWLPGSGPLDNQVQWDPSRAVKWLELSAPAVCTAEEQPRHRGKVKTYNMSAGYGFLTCSAVDRDVYFARAELPGSLQQRKVSGNDFKARRSDWFKGYDVTFVLDLQNVAKPQAKSIQFVGTPPEY